MPRLVLVGASGPAPSPPPPYFTQPSTAFEIQDVGFNIAYRSQYSAATQYTTRPAFPRLPTLFSFVRVSLFLLPMSLFTSIPYFTCIYQIGTR